MAERIGIIESYIEGPRWARFDIAIRNACWELGLKCEVERDTSFLRESVRFKIEGKESDLLIFKRGLESSIQEFEQHRGKHAHS